MRMRPYKENSLGDSDVDVRVPGVWWYNIAFIICELMEGIWWSSRTVAVVKDLEMRVMVKGGRGSGPRRSMASQTG